MNSSYKAIQYKVCIHHDAVFDKYEPWNNCPAYDTTEFRYRIVSSETGEVLDDAQGYGYKTAQKAYAAYAYKKRDRAKDKEKQEKKKHIIKWIKEHKAFINLLNEVEFEIAKGSWGPEDKFNANLVRKLLADNNYEIDFTANDLLKVFRKIK